MAYGQGYPTSQTLAVWRVGSSKPQLVLPAAGMKHVNVAAAPDGRLWLMWEQSGRIIATRTNKAVTQAGPTTILGPPGGGTVFQLSGEGSAGPLDLIANVTSGGQALWHQQVLPRLQVDGTRRGSSIEFRVLDAGDAVAGARVKAGGKTLTTAANGKTTLTRAPTGRVKAAASKPGYAAATTSVR
jgi:hypothetical protein